MSHDRPLVFVSRPPPGDEAFVTGLRAASAGGYDTLVAPLIRTENLAFEIEPDRYDHLVFTSQRGVDAARAYAWRPDLIAWCVGDQTARKAAELGCEVRSARGNLRSLLELILTSAPEGRFCHLRGREVTGNVAGVLRRAGLSCDDREVYVQSAVPQPPSIRAQLTAAKRVIAPIFSPKTGESFVNQGLITETATIIAISDAVARVFAHEGAAEIKTAAQPDLFSVIAMTVSCLGGKTRPSSP